MTVKWKKSAEITNQTEIEPRKKELPEFLRIFVAAGLISASGCGDGLTGEHRYPAQYRAEPGPCLGGIPVQCRLHDGKRGVCRFGSCIASDESEDLDNFDLPATQ